MTYKDLKKLLDGIESNSATERDFDALSYKDKCSSKQIDFLLRNSNDFRLVLSCLCNENCPVEWLRFYSDTPKNIKRFKLAFLCNAMCPSGILGKIDFGRTEWATKSLLARHQNCPPEILAKLVEDINLKEICIEAVNHPNIAEVDLMIATFNQNKEVREQAVARMLERTTSEDAK